MGGCSAKNRPGCSMPPRPVPEVPKEPVPEVPKEPVPEVPKIPVEEEEPKKPVEEPKKKKQPHKYETIMEEADEPSMASLHSGIFLKQKKKKYWVDEKSGCNCFMVFARELSITWSENPSYWEWLYLQETSDAGVELARLLNVCWLEIRGKFETSHLTPSTAYDVAFVVMMADHTCDGWDVPVSLGLTSPDGSVQQHRESLLDKPKGEWIELAAGNFKANAGEMEFHLCEFHGGQWKRGLIVKGAIIRPRE